MCRLFSLILFGSALLTHAVAHASEFQDCGPNIISNTPECISKAVFEGKDADMPKGIAYEMAIDPEMDKSGGLVIPETIPEAFHLMENMLPHWYLNALRRSAGDNECDVIVNGYSYGSLVITWIWVNWKLGDDNSVLRRKLLRLGFHYNDAIQQALAFGFCAYLKGDNNDQNGIEAIKRRSNEK